MAGLKCLVVGFHLLVLFLGSLSSHAKSTDENLAPINWQNPSDSPSSTYNLTVQGYVYCRCKLLDYDYLRTTFHYRYPGAGVHLKCGNKLVSEGKTDRGGHYMFTAAFLPAGGGDWEAMNRFVEQRCKVYVASTPVAKCTVPESLGPAGGLRLIRTLSRAHGTSYLAWFGGADTMLLGPVGCDKE